MLLSADALGLESSIPLSPLSDLRQPGAGEDSLWQADDPSHSLADAYPLSADSADSSAEQGSTQQRQEIIFIDSGVANGDQLLDALLADTPAGAVQVYLLDSSTDGVELVSSVLGQYEMVDVVHILSHGSAGEIQLGGSTLSANTLASHAAHLQSWADSFSTNGDLLIYGCDLAADTHGRSLVDVLSLLTGADVAASDDVTGSGAQGGDWELEYQTGAVEPTLLSVENGSAWTGTLATIEVSSFDDVDDGGDTSSIASLLANPGSEGISLREAIQAANSDVDQMDTIVLKAGTYTLSIPGTDEDAAETGDLDIRDSLIITGAGANLTSVDGAGVDRVFDIIADSSVSVSMADFQIKNGAADGTGGGIQITRADHAASVELSGMWLLNNVVAGSSWGGGIYNSGDLLITNTLIEENSAPLAGGIANTANATLSMVNSTFSGNQATESVGGAIANGGAATLLNVTMSENTALNSGGGVFGDSYSTLTLQNSIFAGNAASSSPDIFGAGLTSSGGNLIGSAQAYQGLHPTDQTGIDPNMGPLKDNGGPTKTYALQEGSAAIDNGNSIDAPQTDQRGVPRTDGNTDSGSYESLSIAEGSSILFSTNDGETDSGVPGLDEWESSSVLEIGGAGLQLGGDTTAGDVVESFNHGSLGLAGEGIDAIHYVSRDIRIGQGDNTVELLAGDLLLSLDKDGITLTGSDANSVTVDDEDVYLFRPDSVGDYSQGSFSIVLDGAALPDDIDAVSLVEQQTIVGDTVLEPGEFLLVAGINGMKDKVLLYSPGSAGEGTTSGSIALLIDGSNIELNDPVVGVELIEQRTRIGGVVLASGQVLLTLSGDEDNVGSEPHIAADANDIFSLTVSATGINNTVASAQMVMDGSQVNLNTNDERLVGLSLVSSPANLEQLVVHNNGLSVWEGSSDNAIGSADLLSFDPDGDVADLVYTLTSAVEHGELQVSGTAVSAGDTFGQSDINTGALHYDHDGSETLEDGFIFQVDDGEGAVSTGLFSISVTPRNDEQILVASSATTDFLEGSISNSITTDMLQTLDEDNSSSELVYTLLTVPANGDLKRDGVVLAAGHGFTQYDIDHDRLSYDHDGSETIADTFHYSVDDGVGTVSTAIFSMGIVAVNDEQLVTPSLPGPAFEEGSAGNIITDELLQTTDVDNSVIELVYTLSTLPSHGALSLGGLILDSGDSFSQDDIDNDRLSYDHDGSETNADSFDYTVDDGAGTVSTGTFRMGIVAVNDEQLVTPSLPAPAFAEGSADNIITDEMLQTTDVDNSAAELAYTLATLPSHGALSLGGFVLESGDSFSQDDIDNDRLSYDHDGSETLADSFDYTVDDGVGAVSTGTFRMGIMAVNDEQLVTPSLPVPVFEEGSAGNIITDEMLQSTDMDNNALELVYTLSTLPSYGSLRLDGVRLEAGNIFTQDDINNEWLSYDHDGSETLSDAFGYSVDDGAGTVSTGTFGLGILAVNDEQRITPSLPVPEYAEGSEGNIITNEILQTTDADNGAAELIYTLVSLPSHGMLTLDGTLLGSGESFTQEAIDKAQLRYHHDGSETTSDTFRFVVDDGMGGASTGVFDMDIVPVNDEQVVIPSPLIPAFDEGSSDNRLDDSVLHATDVDNDASELIYTVLTLPSNGVLRVDSVVLQANGTFSQHDVEQGLLHYDHDGSETVADSIELSVDDGGGDQSRLTLEIAVNPVNDAPEASLAIDSQIATEDRVFSFRLPPDAFSDRDAEDLLRYTVTQSNGDALPDWLTFNNETRALAGTPAGTDVGVITVAVTVEDKAGERATQAFSIQIEAVDDPPRSQSTSMLVSLNKPTVLTPDMLMVVDEDTSREELTINVERLVGGRFALQANPAQAISSFTLKQVVDGEVVFVDDGDDEAPSYDLYVSDGESRVGPLPVSIELAVPPLSAAQESPELPGIEEALPSVPDTDADTDTSTDIGSPAPSVANKPENIPSEPGPGEPEETVADVVAAEDLFSEDVAIVEEMQFDQMDTVSVDKTNGEESSGNSTIMDLLAKNATIVQILSASFDLDPISVEIRSLLSSDGFSNDLSRMSHELNDATYSQQYIIGSSAAVTTGFSVGYVIWLLRGGVLLSTVLSSLPAWQFIDPLPVLASTNEGRSSKGNDESLQDIIHDTQGNGSNQPEPIPNGSGSAVPVHPSAGTDS